MLLKEKNQPNKNFLVLGHFFWSPLTCIMSVSDWIRPDHWTFWLQLLNDCVQWRETVQYPVSRSHRLRTARFRSSSLSIQKTSPDQYPPLPPHIIVHRRWARKWSSRHFLDTWKWSDRSTQWTTRAREWARALRRRKYLRVIIVILSSRFYLDDKTARDGAPFR